MAIPIKFNAKVASKIKDHEQAKKIKEAKKSKPKANNILDILEIIRQDVENNLGEFRDHYQTITTIEDLEAYIEGANAYGEIAIDTETTGLNPLVDQIVGVCLYYPGAKAAYVPINHVDYFSNVRIPEQLTEKEVLSVLKKLTAKVIYHNAQFDIRVILHTIGVYLKAWWDTLICSQIMNENEAHGLKYLHGKYISHTDEKSFGDLFNKIGFKYVPIEYATLYGAHDAIDTFELKDFQYDWFMSHMKRDDVRELYNLYREIEIPMIDVIVDLEDTGVAVDVEYLNTLADKYHKKLFDALDKCIREVETTYKKQIDMYNATHIGKPLSLPINIGSSTQLAILFYDILKCHPVEGKGKRSTDEDVMKIFGKSHKIAKYILDYRAAQKITSTYVDNIPSIIHTDGRVHTHFNSNGAKTGRMSSSDPINLQNIPAHNIEIRKMFVGQTTYRDVEQRSDGAYIFDRCEEVETTKGWKFVEELKAGDELIDGEIVKVVKVKEFKVLVGLV